MKTDGNSSSRHPACYHLLGLAVAAIAGFTCITYLEYHRRTRAKSQLQQELRQGTPDEHSDATDAASADDMSEAAELARDELYREVMHLWMAALAADVQRVRQLLSTSNIPPDTLHPFSQSPLILDIASMDTGAMQLPARARVPAQWTEPAIVHGFNTPDVDSLPMAHDYHLVRVLVALSCAGWSMCVQDPATGENALHILAAQHNSALVSERLGFFIRHQEQNPRRGNMLETVTSSGEWPEDCVRRGETAMAKCLRNARLSIRRAAEAAPADDHAVDE